ncbi:uncharacterized protein LOC114335617 [Diabrotica virgifera virgifera]|uniref:Uncharacterized protein LOC114335617 n=1 Tax=Diabrotica virgifera virgifera TaxID=50390 RepID=A0A6P7FYU3_DIAVI|nr:uncharacterized protein LOC114335617 [Diabrotica virgifera virgifera]
MIYFILASVLIASATAQGRPSFAGSSSKGVPDVASRFKTEGTVSNQAPQDFASRLGVPDRTPERIPVDPNVDLKNRVNTWPDENKPFWHVNAEAIQKHIGASPNRETNFNGNRPVSTSGNQEPVFNTGNQRPVSNTGNQGFENRFGAGGSQSGPQVSGNSFSIFMNNQWKTYVYDPNTDAWYAKRN